MLKYKPMLKICSCLSPDLQSYVQFCGCSMADYGWLHRRKTVFYTFGHTEVFDEVLFDLFLVPPPRQETIPLHSHCIQNPFMADSPEAAISAWLTVC